MSQSASAPGSSSDSGPSSSDAPSSSAPPASSSTPPASSSTPHSSSTPSSNTTPSSTTPTSTTPTSTTPTTTPVTTTPTTTPDQTTTTPTTIAPGETSTTVATVPASGVSSSSSTTTTPKSTSSTLTQTSVITSNGVPITTIFTTTAIGAQTTSSSSTSSSSHTGAIVGGVVGGVAVLGILGLLLFCFLRRRKSEDDFDGNFDPDRVVGHSSGGGTLPQVDLGTEVTPFEYGGPGLGEPAGPHMTQYGGSSAYGGMAATQRSMSPPSHYPNTSFDGGALYNQPARTGPGSSDTSGSHYGPSSHGGEYQPGNTTLVALGRGASTASSQSQPLSAKEREAMTQRYGRSGALGLASQTEESGPSGDARPTSAGSESVVVHSDGGRVNQEEHEQPREIPPAYDSIPADERGQ